MIDLLGAPARAGPTGTAGVEEQLDMLNFELLYDQYSEGLFICYFERISSYYNGRYVRRSVCLSVRLSVIASRLNYNT